MRDLIETCALLCLPLLCLTGCPTEDPPVSMETETETGEPSCLDTGSQDPDIVINTNEDIQELQLSECVNARMIISGGQITDLTPLANVLELKALEIRSNSILTTLLGLDNLVRVDELIITMIPVLLTAGVRLFDGLVSQQKLEFVGQHRLAPDMIQLTVRVRR